MFNKEEPDCLIHTARRSKVEYSMKIEGEEIKVKALQIEQDGILECAEKKMIISVECKNVDNGEFEIRQLFSAMKYYKESRFNFPEDYLYRFLFLIRNRKKGNNYFKLYEYKFEDEKNPNSIKLVKSKQYNII